MNQNNFWQNMVETIRFRFDLSEDQDFAPEVIDDIEKTIVFKGTNLWALIFSIMIASVGLNVNSTAVVIGAMLISPLMGPIMGLGLGVGIFDYPMIKRAAKNLGIMVVVSLLTSTLYFLLTPLKQENSELLGRTVPTLYDVLIAFFGGLAGIVAGSRKAKGNAVAGVAIATALMPPICTAGWGLATGQFYKFLGAFYLFSINTVMISVSTYMVVRFLNFPVKEFVTAEAGAKVRRYVSWIVFVTIVPSIYLAYTIIQKAIVEQKVEKYVVGECKGLEGGSELLNHKFDYSTRILDLYFYGEPLSSKQTEVFKSELNQYEIGFIDLKIHQGVQRSGVETIDETALRAGIIKDLYENNEEALKSKESQIGLLEKELKYYKEIDASSGDVVKEMLASYPNVTHFSVNRNILYDIEKNITDTVPIALVEYKRKPKQEEINRLENWLKVRLKADTLVVILK